MEFLTIAFVKALPQVQVILSGMSTLEQVEDNVNTFSDEYALTEQECDKMAEVARAFKHCMTVPCTACRYCCDDCQSKIDIPKFIENVIESLNIYFSVL